MLRSPATGFTAAVATMNEMGAADSVLAQLSLAVLRFLDQRHGSLNASEFSSVSDTLAALLPPSREPRQALACSAPSHSVVLACLLAGWLRCAARHVHSSNSAQAGWMSTKRPHRV